MLAEPLQLAGAELFPSGSIGVAVATGADDTPERLLREADAAMYRAKAGGRARRAAARRRPDGARRALRTEAELHQALRRGELVLHYQPVVALAEQERVAAVEALVRWHHPERGLVGPGEFIGTAEDTGLIRRLGGWVLQEACRQLAAWDAAGLAAELTSPSTSRRASSTTTSSSRSSPAALAEHGLAPGRLCVEIGESALADAAAGVTARLRALGELGVRIAIDARLALAWATGSADAAVRRPSALARIGALPRPPAQARPPLRRPHGRPSRRRAASSTPCSASRARSASQAVAEGIEEPAVARALAELGCPLGQGHAFAAAAPARSPSSRCSPAPAPAPGGARSACSCATTRPRCATCSARSWSGAATSRSWARPATARA